MSDIEDVIPEDTVPETPITELEFTDPCLGSVGQQPMLHDVQAQLNENHHAERMGRKPVILPIKCGFCQGYHEANQLDAASVFPGKEFESYAYERIVPKYNAETYIPEDLLKTAAEAVTGTPGGLWSDEVVTNGSEPK